MLLELEPAPAKDDEIFWTDDDKELTVKDVFDKAAEVDREARIQPLEVPTTATMLPTPPMIPPAPTATTSPHAILPTVAPIVATEPQIVAAPLPLAAPTPTATTSATTPTPTPTPPSLVHRGDGVATVNPRRQPAAARTVSV